MKNAEDSNHSLIVGNVDMQTREKTLWLFNLATDLDDNLLAVSHFWIEEFSKHFGKVEVYSTHVGRYEFPRIVNVTEIGGGNIWRRIRGLAVIARACLRIIQQRKSSVVFHHMSPRTALIMAIPLKIFSVKQSLWYSHKYTSLSLRFGKRFLEHIFTASEFSVGFKGKNLRYVRNAVPTNNYRGIDLTKPRVGIGSLGRVMPVKRLEVLLESLSQLSPEMKHALGLVTFYGPEYLDEEYTEKLREISRRNSLRVEFIGSIPNHEISTYLTRLSIYFTGTLGGIDKSTIEAGLCGCFIVSDNSEALRLAGMNQIYQSLGLQGEVSIEEQIKMILTNPRFGLKLRRELHQFGVQNNSLENLIQKIVQEMVQRR